MTDSGFKHIAVTAADEDDEVITAGVKTPGGGQSQVPDALVEKSVLAVEARGVEVAPQSAQQEKPPADKTTAVQEQPARAPKDTRSSSGQDGYRQTTLSDLEPEPMPTTQKVVIIAAVVCIIGALVYYFMFMR